MADFDFLTSRASFARAVTEGGDRVRWGAGGKGSFSNCPSCKRKGRRGKVSVGPDDAGKIMFFCHRCSAKGDSLGLLAGYRYGNTDTRNLGGRFKELLSFFANDAVGAARREVIRGRRIWAQKQLRRSELFSPDQVVLLAWASSSHPAASVGDLLYLANTRAGGHLRDSLRRRCRKWEAVVADIAQQGDADRWKALWARMHEVDDTGRRILSAGARFLAVAAYWAVAKRAPALSVMAGHAAVSVSTARRWWNYWVAAGIFTGKVFVPRRGQRPENQM